MNEQEHHEKIEERKNEKTNEVSIIQGNRCTSFRCNGCSIVPTFRVCN